MAGIAIFNPQDNAVHVRIVGKGGLFGFGCVNKTLEISAGGGDVVTVPKGSYHIQYSYRGDQDVWKGDEFTIDSDSVAQITLQQMDEGNYAVKRTSGSF